MIRTLVAVVLLAAIAQADSVLIEGDGKRWYKGNTHTHTLWSDGDGAPEVAVAWYKANGYDFLSLSEHNVIPVGEKWAIVGDDMKLKPAHVEQLTEQYGASWVELKEQDGRPYMRLKTFDELSAHFNEDESFLLVMAEEVTCIKQPVHVNAINIGEAVRPPMAGDKAELLRGVVEEVRKQSERLGRPMFAHLNHPNFSSGVSADQVVDAGGVQFFEVYNGHSGVDNWGNEEKHMPTTDRLWDIMLAKRLSEGVDGILYGVATDDAHNYYRESPVGGSIAGRGWTMVLTNRLAADAIVEAYLQGAFYASVGVTLTGITTSDTGYSVSIAAEEGVTYTTQFIGTPKEFDGASTPATDADGNELPDANRTYSADIGQVFHETTENPATYTFTGDELYVRVKVTSSKAHPRPFREGDREMAWTQPVIVN